MERPRRVLLVSADPLALGGLTQLLAEENDWTPIESLGGSIEDAEREGLSAALVDDPFDADSIGSLAQRVPVLALARDGERAREILAAGASGVVSRRSTGALIARALDAVVEGLIVLDEELARDALRPPVRPLSPEDELTPREREVLDLLALGLSNREIAERLGISFHTVKFHVNSILGKLGAVSRTEVVALAARAGLLTF
jgi:two-component system, NarL family, nitrate/nitrite response regulator NarL